MHVRHGNRLMVRGNSRFISEKAQAGHQFQRKLRPTSRRQRNDTQSSGNVKSQIPGK